jgi:AcrR family transcriptional regulator
VARTGRRPGNQDTREAILAAARDAFAERGYDGASIRNIATSAGVDPALVHHYFGTKNQLFIDAMQFPLDPAVLLPQVAAAGLDGFGERLLRTMLAVWDSKAGGPAAAFIRSAVSNETMARLLREFVIQRILRRMSKELPVDPAEASWRLTMVASQVAGLILVRYIIKIEPMASAPPETVVALFAPTIQRYITDPLPTLTPLPSR